MYLEQLHVCMPFIFTTNIHELHDNLNIYLCIYGLVSEQCFKKEFPLIVTIPTYSTLHTVREIHL